MVLKIIKIGYKATLINIYFSIIPILRLLSQYPSYIYLLPVSCFYLSSLHI